MLIPQNYTASPSRRAKEPSEGRLGAVVGGEGGAQEGGYVRKSISCEFERQAWREKKVCERCSWGRAADRELYVIDSLGVRSHAVVGSRKMPVHVSVHVITRASAASLGTVSRFGFRRASPLFLSRDPRQRHTSSKSPNSTCGRRRSHRHALEAPTRPPTLADGLSDASTIRLIRLKSLAVTS